MSGSTRTAGRPDERREREPVRTSVSTLCTSNVLAECPISDGFVDDVVNSPHVMIVICGSVDAAAFEIAMQLVAPVEAVALSVMPDRARRGVAPTGHVPLSPEIESTNVGFGGLEREAHDQPARSLSPQHPASPAPRSNDRAEPAAGGERQHEPQTRITTAQRRVAVTPRITCDAGLACRATGTSVRRLGVPLFVLSPYGTVPGQKLAALSLAVVEK